MLETPFERKIGHGCGGGFTPQPATVCGRTNAYARAVPLAPFLPAGPAGPPAPAGGWPALKSFASSERFFPFGEVTAAFLIFERVTAFFLSCLAPTLCVGIVRA